MNAAALLEHYERIAEAPDAIARLKRLIIDLAVRGKLVEQDSAECIHIPSAGTSASSIGRRKQSATVELVVDSKDHPFHVPHLWSFVRLGGVLEMINGRAFKPTDWQPTGLPIVRIQNLNNPGAQFNFCNADVVDERHLIRDGDFLISWSGTPGTSFGAFIWSRGLAALNQHIFRCVQLGELFVPTFLRLAINSQLDVLISQAQGGVGLQHVTKGTLEALPLPLPPPSEQHRIVAKVDELMALCDRLEAARLQREATRDRLAAASLARLNTPDPETFQADARFAIGTALPALTTRPDQIKKLRQTIINIAARGALVPQSPRASRASCSVDAAGNPIELCHGWQYVPLEQLLSEGTRNGYSRRPDDDPNGVPILRISAGTVRRDGLVAEEEHKLISGVDPQTRQQYGLQRGDLLACRFNGNKFYVGRLALFKDYLGLDPIYPDKLIRVRLRRDLALPEFIRMAAESDIVRASVEALCATTVGNWGISAGNLKEVPFPLPPMEEQHRIVAKVDELMILCDQLEASLTRSENTRSRLLNALLHEALHPSHDNVVDMDAARQRLRDKREAVASRVVERMSSSKGLGRVRVVKALYFVETHCRTALGGQWGRGDFGPYDHWILSFESSAVHAGCLTRTEHSTSGGGTRIEYEPGPQLSAKAQTAAQVLGDQADEFERVLALLADLDSEESEIIATLYAAGNDLLLEGKAVSDDIVITEFREHWGVPRKASFQPARLRVWLDWMRKNRLTPKGHGPNTRHQSELI